MAGPGDQDPPLTGSDHHDDDLVGFASPASLQGRPRAPEPDAAAPEPEPEVVAPAAPDPAPVVETARRQPADAARLFESPERTQRRNEPARRSMRDESPDRPAANGLYAVYALTLFAVPTFGLSAIIALFAVTGRSGPSDPLGRSHFVYQQRTLWAAAVAALLGVILIVVNIGVFVLFVASLWVLARGAYGVIRLSAGRPIPHPHAWLF